MAEENSSWTYHPDEATSTPKKRTRSISWEASEYIDHKQGFLWFVSLAIVTLILAIAAYFLTKDYFTSGVIGIVGLLAGAFAHHTPRRLNYQLSNNMLKIGEKEYKLSQFKSFSIIEEGPISSIELTPLKRFTPPLSAFFETKDQDKIIDVLVDYLPYEDKDLDGVERLSRRLRF